MEDCNKYDNICHQVACGIRNIINDNKQKQDNFRENKNKWNVQKTKYDNYLNCINDLKCNGSSETRNAKKKADAIVFGECGIGITSDVARNWCPSGTKLIDSDDYFEWCNNAGKWKNKCIRTDKEKKKFIKNQLKAVDNPGPEPTLLQSEINQHFPNLPLCCQEINFEDLKAKNIRIENIKQNCTKNDEVEYKKRNSKFLVNIKKGASKFLDNIKKGGSINILTVGGVGGLLMCVIFIIIISLII